MLGVIAPPPTYSETKNSKILLNQLPCLLAFTHKIGQYKRALISQYVASQIVLHYCFQKEDIQKNKNNVRNKNTTRNEDRNRN